MIKLPIHYTNFNDEQKTYVAHFHLSKRDLISMGLDQHLSTLEVLQKEIEDIDQNDRSAMISFTQRYVSVFEDIFLAAFGVRSTDGERFIKNEETRKMMIESAWYSDWLFDMAQDPQGMANLLERLVPQDLRQEVQAAQKTGAPATSPQVITNETSAEFTYPNQVVETPAQIEARIRAELMGENK